MSKNGKKGLFAHKQRKMMPKIVKNPFLAIPILKRVKNSKKGLFGPKCPKLRKPDNLLQITQKNYFVQNLDKP